jgi:hypothetical protein
MATTTAIKVETRTRPGRCPEHGPVTATKSIPKLRFPFVIWLVRRWIAQLGPYRCPTCGQAAK